MHLLTLLFIFVSTFSFAGEIKALLICDVHAENIGLSVLADSQNVQRYLRMLSKKTGLKLSLKTLSHKIKEPLADYLKDLKCRQDDMVFLYFSGHGYRTHNKVSSPWPNLYLTKDEKAVDFKDICKVLQDKKPRLFIALADCCNNILPEGEVPLEPVLPMKGQKISDTQKNFHRLFLKTSGTIIISSTLPGEFSWCTPRGGLFTAAFLKAISDTTKTSKAAKWKPILEKAHGQITKRKIGQTPHFEINIKEP